MEDNDTVNHIDPDQLKKYKKEHIKTRNPTIETVPTYFALGAKRRRIQREYNNTKNPERRYAEIVIMIKGQSKKERMVRALLDSRCSKSIMLCEFKCKKKRNVLPKSEKIKYKTYGG